MAIHSPHQGDMRISAIWSVTIYVAGLVLVKCRNMLGNEEAKLQNAVTAERRSHPSSRRGIPISL